MASCSLAADLLQGERDLGLHGADLVQLGGHCGAVLGNGGAAANDAGQLLGAGLHVAEVAVGRVDGGLDAGLFLGERRVLVVDAGDLLRSGALELGHLLGFGLDGGLLVAGGHDDAALGQLVQLLAQALDLRDRCAAVRTDLRYRRA